MKSTAQSNIDWLILLPVAALLMFSVAFVYSASAAFSAVKFGSSEELFWNHAIRVIIGLGLMIGVAKIDYHVWERMSFTTLLVALGFLVIVLVMGENMKGASRWVRIGPINFQPSELAKYAIVLHVATIIAANKAFIREWRKGLLPVLLWTLPVCILIALQPNMSTASVIFGIVMTMLFLADADIKHLGSVIGIGALAAGAYAITAQYRVQRLLAFMGMEGADEAVSYQSDQALIAFGNGGITGLGPGQSRQRDWFLPESYGDFIFSIIGEEYGFIGAAVLIGLFVLIMWRGLAVARRAPDSFGRLLAGGITVTLSVYAFVNAGVTCGLLPTTGLPLPFTAYGGSSVFFSTIAVGILLNISAHAGVYTPRKRNEEKVLG